MMWWWIIWKHTKCTKKPLTGTVKMKNLTKSAECQHYRRNSDVGYLWNLSRCKLQVWHEQTEGRVGEVIEGFHVTPRGRWGCWLIKWCQSEEFSFHRLPCCLSPLRWWWYVGGRTNEEMEVSQRSEGAHENHLVFVPPTCSHTPMLLTYYILLILLTDKWLLGPTLIYLGQRQSRFSPSSCFCRIWCLFLTSGAA